MIPKSYKSSQAMAYRMRDIVSKYKCHVMVFFTSHKLIRFCLYILNFKYLKRQNSMELHSGTYGTHGDCENLKRLTVTMSSKSYCNTWGEHDVIFLCLFQVVACKTNTILTTFMVCYYVIGILKIRGV